MVMRLMIVGYFTVRQFYTLDSYQIRTDALEQNKSVVSYFAVANLHTNEKSVHQVIIHSKQYVVVLVKLIEQS
jgi:hypothetical protein